MKMVGQPRRRSESVRLYLYLSVREKCGRKETRSKRNLSDERSCGFYCNFYGRDIPCFRYTPTELSDGYLAGLASNSLEQRVFDGILEDSYRCFLEMFD